MLISRLFLSQDPPILSEEDYEDSPEHQELKERLRKTLYYGRNPKSDRPSLPITEIAVELLQEAAPRELGKLDEFVASSLSHKASVSPCALMIGLIYIERLKYRNPEYLQLISSSDLFLISMMVASKYLYDEGVEEEVFNDEWSDAANMEVADLNELERNFLSAIDWNLFVKETDFRKVLINIERRVAVRKGRERGFYSYSDLTVLSENDQLKLLIREIMLQLCKVVLVCSVAYVASVMTLLGSSVSLGYIRQQSQSIPHPFVSPLLDLADVESQFGLQFSSLQEDMTVSSLRQSQVNAVHNVNLSGQRNTEREDLLELRNEARMESSRNDAKPTAGAGRNGKDQRYKRETRVKSHAPEQEIPKMPTLKTGRDIQPQVTFPNFLTLSVIRDTLVQFLLAVPDQRIDEAKWTKDATLKMPLTSADTNYVCSCGCCQGEVHHRCQNATVNSELNNVEPCWKMANLDIMESDWVPCNVQKCCCPATMNLGPWYQLTSEVNDPLSEIRKGFQTMRLVDAVS